MKQKAPPAPAKVEPKPYLGNTPPTMRVASEMQDAFDYFNQHLFDNKLPPMLVGYEVRKKAYGVFRPKRFAHSQGDSRVDWITLNPEYFAMRSLKQTLSTLVHEMCHALIEFQGKGKVKPYHCKEWGAAMRSVGLEPIIVSAKGKPTGKPTGRNATHEIVNGGPFDLFCEKLLGKGYVISWHLLPDPPRKKSDKPKKEGPVTYVCPSCEEKVKGKRGLSIQCILCSTGYVCNTPEADNDDETEGKAPKVTYQAWLDRIDELMIERNSLTHMDVEDRLWRDEYDNGKSPEEAFEDWCDEVDTPEKVA